MVNVYRDFEESGKREGCPEDLATPFSVPSINMNAFPFVHGALPKKAEGSIWDFRDLP